MSFDRTRPNKRVSPLLTESRQWEMIRTTASSSLESRLGYIVSSLSLMTSAPAVHALTGCDVTSKFGTKSAGIKAYPSAYLENVGKLEGDVLQTLCNAEKYFVQVLNSGNHGIETLDTLRYKMYHQWKSTTIAYLICLLLVTCKRTHPESLLC